MCIELENMQIFKNEIEIELHLCNMKRKNCTVTCNLNVESFILLIRILDMVAGTHALRWHISLFVKIVRVENLFLAGPIQHVLIFLNFFCIIPAPIVNMVIIVVIFQFIWDERGFHCFIF